MNYITIAIELNQRRIVFGATWPTKTTLKALGSIKLKRLKDKVKQLAFNVAMAVIPMPTMVLA